MPQTATIYRVLVASPSDCTGERRLIPDVIYGWNAVNSYTSAAILEPVLWETHARPAFGDRPQSLINKQLVDTCDILVGTFWTRLGTATGKAESGTAEEIERFRAEGKPVLVYFSSAPVVPESIDPSQYQALSRYKQKLENSGLYFGYESLAALRDLLQRHIASTMTELHRPAAEGHDSPTPTKRRGDLLEYREQLGAFLRRLDAEWASERDSSPMNIEEGQAILSRALQELVTFRSEVVAGLEDVTQILDEAAIAIRKLQRHQLYLDGGTSWREFWGSGDATISKLKGIPEMLEGHAQSDT